MWAKVISIGLKGMEGYLVSVEAGTYVGADSFKIVGLPDAAVKESKERINAALRSMGHVILGQKIIINLSPAEHKKSGPMYDLPMAISILSALHELETDIPEDMAFLGALSLDGSIQPVGGMLPAILAAKRLGVRKLIMPFDDQLPLLELEELEIIHVWSLIEVISLLSGNRNLSQFPKTFVKKEGYEHAYSDFRQIIGHQEAKKALEVAAAGEHHVLMTGPPGCGKSMLAESFPSILPPLTNEAHLEVISLYQLSGISGTHSQAPPFRNPHHSASGISIIGGGQYPKPGEISLAHKGVLFLDEIGEFAKKTLEMLRQPLENGTVTISRTHATFSYPADFILIAAMNPCPCGYAGSSSHYCTCTPKQITSYQNKLSGPLRDRFDIHLTMKLTALNGEEPRKVESSETIRKRVENARYRQYSRYGREICNGRVAYDVLLKTSPLTAEQAKVFNQISIRENWSNRTQIKILRLARTISDLQEEKNITDKSVLEAMKLNNNTQFPLKKQNHTAPAKPFNNVRAPTFQHSE